MINISYIPEAENIKLKLSRWLYTRPEAIHLVYSKADALLTLISYITQKHQINRIISLRGLEQYTDKFQRFFTNSQFLTFDIGHNLEEISNNLLSGDLFIAANPMPYTGCLLPVKRIHNLCLRKSCFVIFDLSLSFYWLGYDLGKTGLQYVTFSLNPLAPDSSPVAIIAPGLNTNYILGEVKDWPYNIDLSDRTKSQMQETLADLGQSLDKLLLPRGFTPLCDRQIPTHRTFIIPGEINTGQLSAILQFAQINHHIDNKKSTLTVALTRL